MIKLKQGLIVILTFLLLIFTMLLVDGTFFAPNRLKIKETIIKDPAIPSSINGVKIVYFSDVHYNLFIDYSRFEKIISTINSVNPDVVLFGGDLIDNLTSNPLSTTNQDLLVDLLKRIKAPSGKFYVSGQFESDSDYARTLSDKLLQRAEFESVNDKSIKLYFKDHYINLVGIDFISDSLQLEATINRLDQTVYTLAIAHKPSAITTFDSSKIDLMIAGFTHGGQINFPGFKEVFIQNQMYHEETQRVGSTQLDISNGVGTSELNFRLFADPQINVYILNSK